MTWLNPPAVIEALRDMLVLCPTYASRFGNASTVHYPDVPLGRAPGAINPPLAIMDPINDAEDRPFPGLTLPRGSIRIHLVATTGVTDLEKIARTILRELMLQPTGLALTSGNVGKEKDPHPSARAADEDSPNDSAFKTIELNLTYGINT